jgi:hypothetical protein
MGEARDTWERTNRAWIEDHFILIQAAFEFFMKNGEWPEERLLTRKFAQVSGPRIDVPRAIQTQPAALGLAPHVTFRHVSLGVRHLLGVREARPLLNLLVAIGARAAEVYKTTEDETIVSTEDAAIVGFFDGAKVAPEERKIHLERVATLVTGDYPSPIHGPLAGSPAFFTLAEDVVAEFDDVGSPEDYVRRQVSLLEDRLAKANDARAILEPALQEMGPATGGFPHLSIVAVASKSPADSAPPTPKLRSAAEDQIVAALEASVPSAAPCYQQAVRDLADDRRISYRGTANELRSAVWEVLEHLARDADVSAAPGFQLEPGQNTPTRKQKARYILRARLGETARQTPEATLALIEDHVANLTSGLYARSSVSTHLEAERGEVHQIKMYVDAFLAEVLEIHRA